MCTWLFKVVKMIFLKGRGALRCFMLGGVLCACASIVYAVPLPEFVFYKEGSTAESTSREEIALGTEALNGICNLFSQVDALNVRVNRRSWEVASTEVSSSNELCTNRVYALTWQGREYAFDAWGGFIIDRRYIFVEDMEIISRLEAFFKVHYQQTEYARTSHPLPEVPLLEATKLPVFIGFEADRYQKHDALILKLVKEFNENPAKAIGAAEGMLMDIPRLDPALIKSMMIEETGGNGPRSTRAWEVDPLQVNVPGDWAPVKTDLGLRKPSSRNEGTLEKNLRAGIAFLARKGYGVSGASLKQRPTAYFDSWRVALQRYNGRTAERMEGVTYAEAYANRILQRVQHPYKSVPIATDKYLY
ncbi:MAG: hypothetical protein Q4F99_00935 [bacterium]|nr:hypothetical protein [bacterium]